MKPIHVVASVLAQIVCTPAAGSEAAFAWKGSDIGGGQPTGSRTWDGRTLTVTGAGAGLNVKNADELHFVHVGRPAGDFEVVVRLADFSGEGDARAGIMARADGGASAAMPTVSFQTKDNSLGWMSRIPGAGPSAPPRLFSRGIRAGSGFLRNPPNPLSPCNSPRRPTVSERLRWPWILLLPAALLAAAPLLAAQDDEDEEEEFVQLPLGLVATYQTPDGKEILRRMEPVPRLYARGPGDSVHPKVPADGFRVTWEGRLLVPYDGAYTFWWNRSSLEDLRVTLRGRPVTAGVPVELEFGNVPLGVSGVHRRGVPQLELSWRDKDFAREVVPPRFFGHLPEAARAESIGRQAIEDSGAALAEEFGCFRCHEGPAERAEAVDELPPALRLPGPKLIGVGRRVHAQWLSRYLLDPVAHRPGTRMPAQLGDSPADRAVLKTLAAYLASGQTAQIARASAAGSPKRGEKLFGECGCAACHEPPEGSPVDRGVTLRIPSLERLAEKWTVAGLAGFLRAPLVTRPHGRMPDFALSGREADDLAAYLLSREKSGSPPQFVALPQPKTPVRADAHNVVDPAGSLLVMDLDESAGAVMDASGHNRHATVSGQVKYAQPGHTGGAMRFEGKDGQILVEGSERLGPSGDFTWSAWVKTDADGAVVALARPKGKWVAGGKVLFVRGGRLAFDVGWVSAVTSKTEVTDGQWHHVAVVARADTNGPLDTVTLYIDGRADVTRDDWDIHQHPERDLVLKVGRCSDNFPQGHGFRGLIDEVALWGRALDASEVLALAEGNSHLAATEAALFAPGELAAQWKALGEDPAALDNLAPGIRLKTVAVRLMAAYGCLACHDAGTGRWGESRLAGDRPKGASRKPGIAPSGDVPAPRLAGLSPQRLGAGCLAASGDRGRAPRFDFSESERAALAAYVASLELRRASSLAESIALDMKLLNCAVCHDSEGQGGQPLVALLGGKDKAQFVTPPSLTRVAARLRPERLDEYLREGTRLHRLRPWLAARMPGFGQHGGRLAADLCRRDRASLPLLPNPKQKEPERPAIPQNQIEMGRLLVSSKGLTCVNCHAINGQQPSGAIDPSTRSPDLGLVADHIRKDYFERLVHNPARFFPGTKMPVIFPKDAPPPVPALVDLPEQVLITSLWNYLTLGRQAPKPLEEDPAVVLPDLLRVYVQRGPTFVGDQLFGRGVSCGFPTGTLLFDADTLEPAATWYDGFLVRVPTSYFGMNWRAPQPHEWFARTRHSLVFQAPKGGPWQEPPLPLECDPNRESRFDGYTVGRHAITLRYRLAFDGRQLRVSDRLRIDRREPWRGFVRELTVGDLPEGARAAWTLPEGERRRFFTADGKPAPQASDPAAAPVALYRRGKRMHALRVEAPPGSRWQADSAGGAFRLVGPAAIGGRPLRFRVDQWTYGAEGKEPAVEELASLADPTKLRPPAVDVPKVEPKPGEKAEPQTATVAGGKAPPEEPFSYKIEPIPGPPEGWRPSGTAFTSDGTLYACGLTEGRVYRTRIPPVPAPKEMRWELFATGLNIPTGMNVVDDRLFVAHRPEVTELIDADRDGTAETFRTLMGPWSLKDGFHEYAFGLAVDPQNRLYVGLNNGYFWSYGGPTNRGRHRSDVMRCDLEGRSEQFGHGCRVPNGICRGPEGQIFYCDNQGDWIQVCKLVHCRKGVFYGHPETKDEFLPEGEVPSALPAVWIPYTVIRSAAALRMDDTGGRFGPFAGQIFVGDTGYGRSVNIMRMALEQVDGVWQGAAIRFIDGPPRGPQHTTFGPDGAMYVSCLADGIVRIRYGGIVPMEIHHVSMRRDGRGFVLHFTRPISADAAVTPKTIRARRWYYPYGIRYGSPRVEEVDVPIEKATVSEDRLSIDLELEIKTYKNCMVYYFHVGKLASADGLEVGHPEAWYTVQRVWKRP